MMNGLLLRYCRRPSILSDDRGATEVALDYGIGRRQVWMIRSRRNWGHVVIEHRTGATGAE